MFFKKKENPPIDAQLVIGFLMEEMDELGALQPLRTLQKCMQKSVPLWGPVLATLALRCPCYMAAR